MKAPTGKDLNLLKKKFKFWSILSKISNFPSRGTLMDIHAIWNSEKKLRAATGLSRAEADELLIDFSEKINCIEQQKKKSGGRPNKYPPLNFFLMMMFQLRHHVTFEVLGFMFELDPSNAKRRFESTESIVKDILAKKNSPI